MLCSSQNQKLIYEDVTLLTNFVDNHDGDRFLTNHTVGQLKNALVWSNMWHGIPSFYYGTEVPAVAEATDCRTSQWDAKRYAVLRSEATNWDAKRSKQKKRQLPKGMRKDLSKILELNT